MGVQHMKGKQLCGWVHIQNCFLNPGSIHSTHLHSFHFEELDKGEVEKISFKNTRAWTPHFGWHYPQSTSSLPKNLLCRALFSQHWWVQPRPPGVNNRVSVDSNSIGGYCAHGQEGGSCEQKQVESTLHVPHTPSSLIDRRDFLGDFNLKNKQ